MTEVLFKVLIIGDPTVGKTSFVQRYVNNSFRRDYKMTIGGNILNIKILFKNLPANHWSNTFVCKFWPIHNKNKIVFTLDVGMAFIPFK